METAHPIDEHRRADEIRFDTLAYMDRIFDMLSALRGSRLRKTEFLLIMQILSEGLTRLLWEYYNATKVVEPPDEVETV